MGASGIYLGKSDKGYAFECAQCHKTFYKKVKSYQLFCSKECMQEHRAIIKNFEKAIEEKKKEEEEERRLNARSISQMALDGKDHTGSYGNYGSEQVKETLKMNPWRRKW